MSTVSTINMTGLIRVTSICDMNPLPPEVGSERQQTVLPPLFTVDKAETSNSTTFIRKVQNTGVSLLIHTVNSRDVLIIFTPQSVT